MRIDYGWNERTYAGKASKSIAPVHRHKAITDAHTIADGDLCQYLSVLICINRLTIFFPTFIARMQLHIIILIDTEFFGIIGMQG